MKEEYFIVKRTVIEEYEVLAKDREDAKNKAINPYQITVKSTTVKKSKQ